MRNELNRIPGLDVGLLGVFVALAATLSAAGAASASESSIVWRSSASGVLAAPDPAIASPATPPVAAPVVTYGGNRFAWSVNEPVLITPDVSGGSGSFEWALATVTPLPAGLSFNSATGAFSGRVALAGDYQWSILLRDVTTGTYTTAVARIVVVK